MATQDNQYQYEKEGQFTVRTRDQAAPEATKLMRRLGLDHEYADETIQRTLEDFVINHHLAIEYYQKKLSKIVWWRRLYITISMLLLLVLPIIVVLIGLRDNSNLEILTAIIAGIFAFYRGISAWADMRLVAGALSEASSKLKEAVYTFEQTWDQQSKLPIRSDEFVLAVEAATDEARRTIHNEQNLYFKNLSYPSFDLGSMFGSTGSSARTLVSSYAVTAPEQQKVQRDAVRGLQTIDAEVNQSQTRLNDILVELATLPANAESRRQALEDAREEALGALRTAELKRAEAMGDLEAV